MGWFSKLVKSVGGVVKTVVKVGGKLVKPAVALGLGALAGPAMGVISKVASGLGGMMKNSAETLQVSADSAQSQATGYEALAAGAGVAADPVAAKSAAVKGAMMMAGGGAAVWMLLRGNGRRGRR